MLDNSAGITGEEVLDRVPVAGVNLLRVVGVHPSHKEQLRG